MPSGIPLDIWQVLAFAVRFSPQWPKMAQTFHKSYIKVYMDPMSLLMHWHTHSPIAGLALRVAWQTRARERAGALGVAQVGQFSPSKSRPKDGSVFWAHPWVTRLFRNSFVVPDSARTNIVFHLGREAHGSIGIACERRQMGDRGARAQNAERLAPDSWV